MRNAYCCDGGGPKGCGTVFEHPLCCSDIVIDEHSDATAARADATIAGGDEYIFGVAGDEVYVGISHADVLHRVVGTSVVDDAAMENRLRRKTVDADGGDRPGTVGRDDVDAPRCLCPLCDRSLLASRRCADGRRR